MIFELDEVELKVEEEVEFEFVFKKKGYCIFVKMVDVEVEKFKGCCCFLCIVF